MLHVYTPTRMDSTFFTLGAAFPQIYSVFVRHTKQLHIWTQLVALCAASDPDHLVRLVHSLYLLLMPWSNQHAMHLIDLRPGDSRSVVMCRHAMVW